MNLFNCLRLFGSELVFVVVTLTRSLYSCTTASISVELVESSASVQFGDDVSLSESDVDTLL